MVQVREPARLEVLGERHAEKAAPSVMHDRVRGLDGMALQAAVLNGHDIPGRFGYHEEVADPVDVPWIGQVIGHDLHRPVSGRRCRDRPLATGSLRKRIRNRMNARNSKKR